MLSISTGLATLTDEPGASPRLTNLWRLDEIEIEIGETAIGGEGGEGGEGGCGGGCGGEGGDGGGDGWVNLQMHCSSEEHEPVLPPPQTPR